jgi:hypothetical protein
MTHTEFRLIVKKEILEYSGRDVTPVRYNIGDTITVDESTFLNLQSGETIKRFTREGCIEFDKYNFENEVQYTEVTVAYGTRKLGQRKAKELKSIRSI